MKYLSTRSNIDLLLRTLQLLIERERRADESRTGANDWRQLAQVIDRLLFWVFLVFTLLITLALLAIAPSMQ
jgi:nicotinic acetylcholine receptor